MCIRVYLLVYEHLYITFTNLYVFIYVQFKTHICAYNYMYMISTYIKLILFVYVQHNTYIHVIFLFMNVYKISISIYVLMTHICIQIFTYIHIVYVHIKNCLCAKTHVYKHNVYKLHADCIYVYSQITYTYTLLHVYKQAHICVCAHVYAHTVKY